MIAHVIEEHIEGYEGNNIFAYSNMNSEHLGTRPCISVLLYNNTSTCYNLVLQLHIYSPVFSGEEIEEGEEMQIVLDEHGQERSVQYIEEEHAEYPGGTMEVISFFRNVLVQLSTVI